MDNEILLEFCSESKNLVLDLRKIVEQIDNNLESSSLFDQYGQIIDRIMGAAKSMGEFPKLSQFTELGKSLSYKTSQADDIKLREIVLSILEDQVDILDEIILEIEKTGKENVESEIFSTFITRVKWALEKLSHIKRSSVKID